MKVCLINPPTSRPQDDLFFPMGLITVGSVLKENGIDVELVDFDLWLKRRPELREDYASFKDFALDRMLASRAEVFGVSSICSNFPFALDLARLLKKAAPEAKIVLGGPQPSSVPVEAMSHCSEIDAIVVGEGEDGFLELLRSDWSEGSLNAIKGLCHRAGGPVQLTEIRPQIDDLDRLPIPDFSLVDVEEYQKYSDSLALIEAGRGCPFRCNFCSTAEMWRRSYRVKTPARIHAEMKCLHEAYGMRYFSLTHDNFTTSPKYLRKFCHYFLENNPEGFTWNSSARTDTLKLEDLDLMHRAGCRAVFYGVDSGAKRIQDMIDKHLDLEEFRLILQETVRRGISAITSFIVGFPEETEADIDATIDLALWSKHAGATEVQIHRLSPLSSTKVHHQHSAELTFRPLVSDISFLIFGEERMLEEIASHPRLFSSFFELPLPHLEDLDIFCFSNFYHALVNDIGAALYRYLRKAGKSPTAFFREWNETQKSVPYIDRLYKSKVLQSVAECF